jgi:septum formation protein
MLEKAGISFIREPANINEHKIKEQQRTQGSSGEQTALTLAEAKARHVSIRRPGDLVIGADQILECQGDWFDKPADRTEALQTLRKLRNRTHLLVSAVAATRDGLCLWRHVERARLTMRPFTDEFLRHYLDESGDEILASVGAYRIEGMGIHLFSHIEGDHFTILGMPLLPLLDFLRRDHLLAGQ